MLSRRLLIGSGLAALATPAKSEILCQPLWEGAQRCEVGVRLPHFYRAEQECQNWCWAACIQMAFAYYGHLIPQRAIVGKLYADAKCERAAGTQIVQTINGWWRDNNGVAFQAGAEVLWDTNSYYGRWDAAQRTAHDLAAGAPLIIGALGHATMLTAMMYDHDVYGRSQVLSLTVRDPWPSNPARRVLSQEEVAGTVFLTRIGVSN